LSCLPIAISRSASSPERCGSLTTLSSSTTSSARRSVFQGFSRKPPGRCDPQAARLGSVSSAAFRSSTDW
jgi:hypothetical protein